MKKILFQLFIVMLFPFATGCHTNIINLDEYDDLEYGSSLDFKDRSQLKQRVSAEGHFCELNFDSEGGWRLLVEDEEILKWLTISSRESNKEGSHRLLFGVDENSTGVERTASFQIMGNGDTKAQTIVIIQSAKCEDGSLPLPYEEDTYTDVVEKIAMYINSNSAGDRTFDEWRFVYDSPSSAKIVRMDFFSIYPDEDFLNEEIIIDDKVIEHNTYDIKYPEQQYTIFTKKHIEFTMNSRNMITYMLVHDYDYSWEQSQEPIIGERNFSYANHRRAAQRSSANYNDVRCEWVDGNVTQCKAVDYYNGAINQSYTFSFNPEPNNRANIDLNSFLMDDLYSAIGLHGKKCKNLFSSVVDLYKKRIDFQYTFDDKGRVSTIKKQTSYEDSPKIENVLFEIFYR